MSILHVENLNVYYGAIHAVKGISFDVEEGEVVTLIGANGAGKSTTLNTVAGLLKPREGVVEFEGKSLLGIAPHTIVSTQADRPCSLEMSGVMSLKMTPGSG